MALRKVTFNGSSVTSKIDADLNYHQYNKQSGILKGLGNNVSVRTTNSTIYLSSGYISICGRIIYVEQDTSIAIPNTTGYHTLVLEVNTSTDVIQLKILNGTSTYPTLKKDDLQVTSGIYQFELHRYFNNGASITHYPRKEYIYSAIQGNFGSNYVLVSDGEGGAFGRSITSTNQTSTAALAVGGIRFKKI